MSILPPSGRTIQKLNDTGLRSLALAAKARKIANDSHLCPRYIQRVLAYGMTASVSARLECTGAPDFSWIASQANTMASAGSAMLQIEIEQETDG